MPDYDHIILPHDHVESISFKGQGRGKPIIPERDAAQHSAFLSQQYGVANAAYQARKNELPDGVSRADGLYLQLQIDERAQTISSLNGTKGARLMNVRETKYENQKDVTIFIPSRNKGVCEKFRV